VVSSGYADRFHQLPASEVRDTDIAHFSGMYERIECLKGFIERRHAIPFVHLVKINPISA